MVDTRRRIREGGRASAARALRLSVAAVAAYVVAQRFSAGAKPVTAGLTALLIVQVTLFNTITETLRRIVSVLAGVGLAITASLLGSPSWTRRNGGGVRSSGANRPPPRVARARRPRNGCGRAPAASWPTTRRCAGPAA